MPNKKKSTNIENSNANEVPKEEITTQEIMTRHLLNKDDVITDEEFKNLKIEGQDIKEEIESLDFLKQKDRPKYEDKDPENLTPWDVIK